MSPNGWLGPLHPIPSQGWSGTTLLLVATHTCKWNTPNESWTNCIIHIENCILVNNILLQTCTQCKEKYVAEKGLNFELEKLTPNIFCYVFCCTTWLEGNPHGLHLKLCNESQPPFGLTSMQVLFHFEKRFWTLSVVLAQFCFTDILGTAKESTGTKCQSPWNETLQGFCEKHVVHVLLEASFPFMLVWPCVFEDIYFGL